MTVRRQVFVTTPITPRGRMICYGPQEQDTLMRDPVISQNLFIIHRSYELCSILGSLVGASLYDVNQMILCLLQDTRCITFPSLFPILQVLKYIYVFLRHHLNVPTNQIGIRHVK